MQAGQPLIDSLAVDRVPRQQKMSEKGSNSSNLGGLLRTASLTTLFTRKRPHDSDGEADTSQVDDSSDDSQEARHDSKRSKTNQAVERAQLLEQEKQFDDELPEEYRKFRPIGFRFNLPPSDRPVRVYADGVFDLFHLGHMRQLEQAKKALPNAILICGIPSDFETHKRKGLTVLSDYQRCETLKHCKWVDEVIPSAPWCVTPEFLEKHKIDYVAHDDLPYASSDSDDIYKPIKERGMFLTTQRTEGVSTSDIITKIIRDYDKYLMRNFARGATRQELNVSWFKKNELEFKKHINDFRSYWKKTNQNFNNASKDLYFEVREYLLNKSAQKDKKHMMSSPAADFAADYTGESQNPRRRRESASPSFVDNFKDWMHRTDTEMSDSREASENLDKGRVRRGSKSSKRSKRAKEVKRDMEEDEAGQRVGNEQNDEDVKTLIESS